MDFDHNSFLFAANSGFVEDLYLKYLENPENVDENWRRFFANLGDNELQALKATRGSTWLPRKNKVILPPDAPAKEVKAVANNVLNIDLIIREYREKGHLNAKLDPLGFEKNDYNIDLELQKQGFDQKNLNQVVSLNKLGLKNCTIEQLIDKLQSVYSGTAGYEFDYLESDIEKEWLYSEIENNSNLLSNENKIEALKDLIDVEGFEQFIHNRFPGTKRFSIEGGESSILSMKEVINVAALANVEEVIIGMAHRGRLNVLTKIMGKDYAAMLSEFQGNFAHVEELNISGDVKYHMGRSADFISKSGNKIHLSLTPNPSHLEAVNPVVAGKVRAKQDGIQDSSRSKVMGILVHGDAAFCGQGVVVESLCLSNLASYTTGGIMHIVVNNQVGFTTLPKDARSGRYPTEFAKVIKAPVIHVNGDDVEKVIMVSALAERYRQKFKKDIVIDITCYRKYGHNEGDEPMFTQPIMYDEIKTKKSITEIYATSISSLMSAEQVTDYKAERVKFLDKKLEEAKTYKPKEEEWLKGKWQGMEKHDRVIEKSAATGISLNDFNAIGKALVSYPSDFSLNSKIARLLEQRKKMLENGEGFDWATAELLAYGALLMEGSKVRMSGQDCKRGTFSHRHAVLFDQISENEYTQLNNIKENQANLEVINSNLSEYAVLGFEYGYSTVNPKDLTIWEAQFGDFANGAQIMIDQFIASAEVKWLRMSGLILLLPHGYEGQGPEHSSARLERYLQLCAEDNMQVINCTNPANFFHAIRRQIHRKFRKPLIVMSPKSLLRHKMVVSNVNEFIDKTEFRPVIGDETTKAKRLVLCSGKIYFDLLEERAENKDVALIRLEQYYPFPEEQLKEVFAKYGDTEVIWCQEEPENMGAWRFIENKLEKTLSKLKWKNNRAKYIGRPESASTSAGYQKMHVIEQTKIIKQAISGV